MKKLLIISTSWPAPHYSAAGVRLMQLVDFFKEEAYKVTIACTADKSDVKESDFEGIVLVPILLNDSSFDTFISDLNPDIVLFDRFMAEEQFGWRVAEHAPNAIRILDTEDLHSLRKVREQAIKQNLDFTTALWLQNDLTKREMASIYRCDLTLIISSFEMELLKPIFANHESLLLHLPFMMNGLDDPTIKWTPFEERKDFIFIGFGGHAPNVDAIGQLKKEIWPLIKMELPQVVLHIYGSNLPQHISQMHDLKTGFLIEGWAESAEQVVANTRIMLAPLRFGAGLKGKLANAMRCGTPSVTTTIGAEGMHDGLPWNGMVCDDPKAFAEAAIALYWNKKDWELFQRNGIAIINEGFDKKTLGAKLRSRITSVKANLVHHRAKNFLGEMLRYQTMASTKYMAKWIEEKNRKQEGS